MSNEKENEEHEFASITLANLTAKFGGDAAKAENVFREISTQFGFGVGTHATLSVASAPEKTQKTIFALIEKRAKEKPIVPVDVGGRVERRAEKETPVVSKPEKPASKDKGRARQKASKRKAHR